ncbi:hypothetical protein ACUJ8S_11905 [Proteus mirabilis]|nr:hypothetical protein [Proteus mirabilis]MDM3664392.1 hypothetical protein [Proteus mirabilis]MDM3676948.1 hypothetical protein [Proteus mirabilis]
MHFTSYFILRRGSSWRYNECRQARFDYDYQVVLEGNNVVEWRREKII